MLRPGTISHSRCLVMRIWSWPVPQTWDRKRWYVRSRCRRGQGTGEPSSERSRSSRSFRAWYKKSASASSTTLTLKPKMTMARGSTLSKPKKSVSCSACSSSYILMSIATSSVHTRRKLVATATKAVDACLYGAATSSTTMCPTLRRMASSSRSSECACGMRKTKPVRSSLRTTSTSSHMWYPGRYSASRKPTARSSCGEARSRRLAIRRHAKSTGTPTAHSTTSACACDVSWRCSSESHSTE
mmetsp:Transcript_47408/g.124261  ORF Transcript_47408/g.124261 Transcript_47408/m.124261 type:complete len:243 (+) Transcript_47408:1351-2079(+)